MLQKSKSLPKPRVFVWGFLGWWWGTDRFSFSRESSFCHHWSCCAFCSVPNKEPIEHSGFIWSQLSHTCALHCLQHLQNTETIGIGRDLNDKGTSFPISPKTPVLPSYLIQSAISQNIPGQDNFSSFEVNFYGCFGMWLSKAGCVQWSLFSKGSEKWNAASLKSEIKFEIIDLKSEIKFGVPLRKIDFCGVWASHQDFWVSFPVLILCFPVYFCWGMIPDSGMGRSGQVSVCASCAAGPDLFHCRMSARDHKPCNDIFLSLELEFCWNVLLFSPPLSGESWTCVLWKQHKTKGVFLYPLKSPIICLQVLKPKRSINPDCT